MLKEHVTAGYAQTHWQMQKTSDSGEIYQHTVLPLVENIAPNKGLIGGQDIFGGQGYGSAFTQIQVGLIG